MSRPLRCVAGVAGLLLLLGGCAQEEVRIGAKDFTENRILAEMFVALARDAGVRVVRVAPAEDRGEALASLRAGTLDVYADYVTTLLGRMGYDGLLDREEARQRVTGVLAAVGVEALPPLGFDDGYIIATSESYARQHGLETLRDLVGLPERPRIGVNRGFARLPNRGLEEVLGVFGLQAAEVVTRDNFDRAQLYDLLLDQKLDLVVGFRTDPQLDQYPLRTLGPAEENAPNYDALPLVRAAAAEANPALVPALEALAGRLDTATMRRLVARVDLDGQTPRNVARAALVELGLVEVAPYPEPAPLKIAVDGAEVDDPATVSLLRSVRRAVPRRRVRILSAMDPLQAVLDRKARTALIPSVLLFGAADNPTVADPRFESLVAAGRSVAHLLAPVDREVDPEAVLRVATGPEGSASWRLFEVSRPWLPDRLRRIELPDSAAGTAAEALQSGVADLALLVATLSRSDLETVLAMGRVRLADASLWLVPEARLALPFLRPTFISAGRYAPSQAAVSTVAMQRVLVGPAPPGRRRVLGRGGPSTYSEELFPLPDHLVLALNNELGNGTEVAPQLSPARVLQPQPIALRAPLNPSPGQTLLGVAIIAYLLWCLFLLLRPREAPL